MVDGEADEAFCREVRRHHRQDSKWTAGYVEHELSHVRHVFTPELCPVEGIHVLEFGCNIGATAIVLAHLGAVVTAVDIDPDMLGLARLNARRYGVPNSIRFARVAPTGRLPFVDDAFSLITCNSVLEYVPDGRRGFVLRELDRVLRPGGRLLVFGTSNRLWPREVHTGRWLVNYVPVRLDRWLRPPLRRGVWPWSLRRDLAGYRDRFAGTGAPAYLAAKSGMGSGRWRRAALVALTATARLTGLSPGILAPNITLLLEKPVARSSNLTAQHPTER